MLISFLSSWWHSNNWFCAVSPACCSTRKHEHCQVLPSCQKMQNFAQHRLAQNALGKQKVKVSLDWDYFGLHTDLPSESDVRVHLALLIVGIVLIFLMNLFLQCWRGCIKQGQKINVKNTELISSWKISMNKLVALPLLPYCLRVDLMIGFGATLFARFSVTDVVCGSIAQCKIRTANRKSKSS